MEAGLWRKIFVDRILKVHSFLKPKEQPPSIIEKPPVVENIREIIPMEAKY
jgi:hypothetical protein